EGVFYHVTLYEGTGHDGVADQLASCDCGDGRSNPTATQIAAHLHGRRAWFSVLSTRSTISYNSQDGKRCVVSVSGSDLWTCSASHCSLAFQSSSACIHRQRAHKFWNDANATGLDNMEETAEDYENEDVAFEGPAVEEDSPPDDKHIQIHPCSHLRVPPPPFCRLPSDAPSVPVIPAERFPAQLPLGVNARCDCGKRSDADKPIMLRRCTIYFSNGAIHRDVETQQFIVAHELLNAYTSQLCASPTPFTAFCSTTQHAYEQHGDGLGHGIKFLTRPQFVKLYFAYISLQQLDVSFSCKICGPTPSVVIADGVVLAFSAALKHANLDPPTNTGKDVNDRARPGSIIPFLSGTAVRAAARRLATSLDASPTDQVESLQQLKAAITSAKFTSPVLQLWAGRFHQLAVEICLAPNIDASLRRALQHLIEQFSASEGILQLCRPRCQPLLREISGFDASQITKDHFARLSTTLARHCPFVGSACVMFAHADSSMHTSTLFKSLQALILSTADAIEHQLFLLNPRPAPMPLPPAIDPPKRYTQTGSLYGATKCRSRPTYPRLDEGKEGHSGEKQAVLEGGQEQQCRKFYDEYVKRQRTGGLMALWCTHCICVGFHVIPHAEGRNDVFSAIFSHWPTPPSVVVYDFACQLGPYSLRREPGFFKDTLFVVDQMHEKGHTNCSPASRLSTYMRNDPALQHIYSSAAECGNAGLGRIKKSVAYCKQEHAVALVRVFLSVWNRRRMRG
ncbi:hypothetical protein OC844_007468, partial [Tilletia horrida]